MTRRTFLASVSAASQAFSQAPSHSSFHGTFLQLQNDHLHWSKDQWLQLFQYFRQLKLKRIILQWTKNEEISFIPLVPSFLKLAHDHRMQVHLGLLHRNQFWHVQEDGMENFLSRLLEEQMPFIRELYSATGKLGFAGWYISQELDDERWSKPEMREIAKNYLHLLTRQLRQTSSGKMIAVSAFSNGKLSPEDYAEFSKDLLRSSGINEFLFQDGIGTRKLDLPQAREYLQALQNTLGKRLTPIIEIFEQTSDDPFTADPASMERIIQQLDLFDSLKLKNPVAFSVPEYITPSGGAKAAELFQRFTQSALPAPNI